MNRSAEGLLGAVLLCVFMATGAVGENVGEEVPPAVLEVGAKAFPLWKKLVRDDADAFGLAGKEHLAQTATLGDIYMMYRLTPDDIADYVASDAGDPAPFASFRTYVFPIYADSVYLGGIRVAEQKRHTVRAAVESGGYGLEGIDALNLWLGTETAAILNASREINIRVVGVVGFIIPGTESYFILERQGERLFLPSKSVRERMLESMSTDALGMYAISEEGMRAVKQVLEARLEARQPSSDRR
jgi:hypothetical protein